jgi:histidine phosphotransfer protein HptB
MSEQRTTYQQIIRNHLRTAYLLPDDRVDTLLPRYLASLQELMARLEHSAETASPEEAGRAAHALKGALLSLGLKEMAEKAYAIEQTCLPDMNETDCRRLIAGLKEEIAEFV